MPASTPGGGPSAPSSWIGRCVTCVPNSGGRGNNMSWKPLLTGELKDRAWERVREIADHLSVPPHDPAGDPSLAGGTTGLALLHGYLALAGCGPDHAGLAVHFLERATAALSDRAVEASLYSGLTGLGWAIQHLRGR